MTKIAERIHIAPVGFEVDRIVLPAKQWKADKVYLLVHDNKSEDKATAWIKDSNDEYVPFGSSNASVRFMQQPDCGNQGDLQEIIVPMSALYPEFVIDSTMVPPTGTEDQIIPAFEITTTKPNSFGDPISITCGFFKKEFKQLDSRFPKATAISMMSSQARQVTGGAVTMSDGCFGGAAGA